MYRALLITYVVLHSILLTSSESRIQHENIEEDFRQDTKVIRQFKMRCSRRYSPGVCASHVSSVWTFVLQEQNCTERLGCANEFRSNRFKTYKICMQQCHGFVDMYLQLLEGVPRYNNSVPLRKGDGKSSRVNVTAMEHEKEKTDVLTQEKIEDVVYDDYEQGENETHSIVYKELLKNEGIFPPDVDRIDGEIRSQFDLLHP